MTVYAEGDRDAVAGRRSEIEPADPEASFTATDVGFIQHRIMKTDTLAGLALRYKITVSDIKRANGLLTDSAMFARPFVQIPTAQLPVGEEVHVLFARLMSGYGRDASLNAPERRAPGTVAAAQLPGTPISAAASRRCSEADDDTRAHSRRATRAGHRAGGPGDVELILLERAAAAAAAAAPAPPEAPAGGGGGGAPERARRRSSRSSGDGPAGPAASAASGALAGAAAAAALRRAGSAGRPPLPAKRANSAAVLSAAVEALSAAGSMGSLSEAADILMVPEPPVIKQGVSGGGGGGGGPIAAWGSGIDLSAVPGRRAAGRKSE